MANYHSPNHLPTNMRPNYPTNRTSTTPNAHSATSFSSPFQGNSQYYGATGFTPLRSGNQRAEPQMVSRNSYNTPYNPGEWVGGARLPSEREMQDRSARHIEEGLNSPPPPYSPPPSGASPQAPLAISPAQITPHTANTLSPRNYSSASSRDTMQSATQIGNPHLVQTSRHFSPQSAGHFPISDHSSPAMQSVASPDVMQSQPTPRATSMNFPTGYVHDAMRTPNIPGPPARPPVAKRASSAGPSSAGPSRDSSMTRDAFRPAWQPGMPLPGPPPGPPPVEPPSASRSQSASGIMDSRSRSRGPMNTNARTTIRAPMLDTIPATPANWEDGMKSPTKPLVDLRINTNVGPHRRVASVDPVMTATRATDPAPPPPTNFTLSRSSAKRDSSAHGILERRARRQSIQDQESARQHLTIQPTAWTDATNGGSGSRQSSHDDLRYMGADSTDEVNDDTDNTSAHEPIKSGRLLDSQRTPRLNETYAVSSATPPETPAVESDLPLRVSTGYSRPSGKGLPTPPLSQKTPTETVMLNRPRSASVTRNESASEEYFMAECTKRHQEFLAKERSAKHDIQKLQLFTDFMLNEAAIRRHRYAEAFSSGSFDVVAARGKLFEDPNDKKKQRHAKSATSPQTHTPKGNAVVFESPIQEPDSVTRQEGVRFRDYKPDLSPIVSMDEYSSRGRPPSRWWESDTGSPVDGPRKMKRSKRESKYMGLSAALMQSTIEEQDAQHGYNEPEVYESSFYPEEKANPETFGYYPEPSPALRSAQLAKAPATPRLLDVSRFVTLPPPYPRHYPAVNNAHPDLATYRNTVRSLGDLSEVRERKSRHKQNADAMRSERQRKVNETRRAFREDIRLQIAEGSITYADAAEAEQALVQSEQQTERRDTQAEFDSLQDVVIKPLHDMLNDRIFELTNSIDKLQECLILDAQNSDPDRAQQEGDDTPELLEYLTQLKWLFETRELVHKELFDLVSDRNERYKYIILLPFKHARNMDKVRDTEEFFARDVQDRRHTFSNESLERHQTFFRIIEENIGRGVQVQSSAFWDIAPALVKLLEKIPENVRTMEAIAIPEQELDENPSYENHPNQYLYTLLDHAEKSTYQFIESQTNLHCLLHEAKSSLFSAKRRALETHRSLHNHLDMDGSSELESLKASEETNLTDELKQKVSLIEEQWLEGLGSKLQATRERVRTVLIEDGVWEEMNERD